MDPYGSDAARERDVARLMSLWRRIYGASDIWVKLVGLSTMEAILQGNPDLLQVPLASELVHSLVQARETLRAQELTDSTMLWQWQPEVSASSGPATLSPAIPPFVAPMPGKSSHVHVQHHTVASHF